jgi:uncharacterized RDD family membrane protein YckC
VVLARGEQCLLRHAFHKPPARQGDQAMAVTRAPQVGRLELAHSLAFAGFWRRSLAYLIDAALLFAAQGGLAAAVLLAAPGDLRAVANLTPVSVLVSWAYFALMESSPIGATVGKMTLDLYVTDAHGDPISFTRASWRYWLKLLSTMTLMVGWLMAAFTPQKQALHDVMAGTLVVRRVRSIAVASPAAEGPGEYWDGIRWVTGTTRVDG